MSEKTIKNYLFSFYVNFSLHFESFVIKKLDSIHISSFFYALNYMTDFNLNLYALLVELETTQCENYILVNLVSKRLI